MNVLRTLGLSFFVLVLGAIACRAVRKTRPVTEATPRIYEYQTIRQELTSSIQTVDVLLGIGFTVAIGTFTIALGFQRREVFIALPFALYVLTAFLANKHITQMYLSAYLRSLERLISQELDRPDVLAWESTYTIGRLLGRWRPRLPGNGEPVWNPIMPIISSYFLLLLAGYVGSVVLGAIEVRHVVADLFAGKDPATGHLALSTREKVLREASLAGFLTVNAAFAACIFWTYLYSISRFFPVLETTFASRNS